MIIQHTPQFRIIIDTFTPRSVYHSMGTQNFRAAVVEARNTFCVDLDICQRRNLSSKDVRVAYVVTLDFFRPTNHNLILISWRRQTHIVITADAAAPEEVIVLSVLMDITALARSGASIVELDIVGCDAGHSQSICRHCCLEDVAPETYMGHVSVAGLKGV